MIKRALGRGITSFMYAVGCTQLFWLGVMVFTGDWNYVPLLPEYAAHFPSEGMALLVQTALIGIISAAFGAGTVIMEMERLSLLAQSILFFVVTTAVWVPVGCFCWGMHKYPASVLGISISYTISYTICWVLQYRSCKREIEQINQRLQNLQRMEREEKTPWKTQS